MRMTFVGGAWLSRCCPICCNAMSTVSIHPSKKWHCQSNCCRQYLCQRCLYQHIMSVLSEGMTGSGRTVLSCPFGCTTTSTSSSSSSNGHEATTTTSLLTDATIRQCIQHHHYSILVHVLYRQAIRLLFLVGTGPFVMLLLVSSGIVPLFVTVGRRRRLVRHIVRGRRGRQCTLFQRYSYSQWKTFEYLLLDRFGITEKERGDIIRYERWSVQMAILSSIKRQQQQQHNSHYNSKHGERVQVDADNNDEEEEEEIAIYCPAPDCNYIWFVGKHYRQQKLLNEPPAAATSSAMNNKRRRRSIDDVSRDGRGNNSDSARTIDNTIPIGLRRRRHTTTTTSNAASTTAAAATSLLRDSLSSSSRKIRRAMSLALYQPPPPENILHVDNNNKNEELDQAEEHSSFSRSARQLFWVDGFDTTNTTVFADQNTMQQHQQQQSRRILAERFDGRKVTCGKCHAEFCALCRRSWTIMGRRRRYSSKRAGGGGGGRSMVVDWLYGGNRRMTHTGLPCITWSTKFQSNNNEDDYDYDNNAYHFTAQMMNAKCCPGCSIRVQRTDGCNHMTCGCGMEWCYVCEERWHYGHYGCRLHNGGDDEEEEDNDIVHVHRRDAGVHGCMIS